MREEHEAGRGKRVDREEEELSTLKVTVENNVKRTLEQACKVSGWLTFLSISQDGIDLFKKEFRETFWWFLDLPLQDPPLTCDGCSHPFKVYHTCCCKRGGLVGVQNNILKEEC